MAIYDHRVFRDPEGKWWVAQVHAGGGAGAYFEGEDPRDLPRPRTRELVLFRCLTDREASGRAFKVPADSLNDMSHRSILRALELAEEREHGLKLRPYNAPHIPEGALDVEPFVDQEGLRWITRQTRSVRRTQEGAQPSPAVEVICLDDSALRKLIFLQDEATYQDAVQFGPADIDEALVRAVKDTFDDVDFDEGSSHLRYLE